jgi:hypothetical protein
MTIYDLLYERGLRKKTTEKQVRKAIDYLISKKIFKETRPWGAPIKNKNNAGEYDRRYHYEISKTVHAFKQVLNIFPTKDVKRLLASDYSNIIIGENGFERIYEAIKPRLSLPEFKQFASDSLLHHHATEDEYTYFAKELHTKILESHYQSANNCKKEQEPVEIFRFLIELGQELSSSSIKPIEILSSFDHLRAVRLYRKTLHLSAVKAYDELAEKSMISEGIRNFYVFDNYLSPLTAHPINSIVKILFSKPFERIYEDAYLIDGDKFWVLSGRASAIYNNFSDVLFEYFKHNPLSMEDPEVVTKQMIYSWNVASTRFDVACNFLAELYEKKIGSGNYHLISSDLDFNVFDLVDNKQLLPSHISSSLLIFGSTPSVFSMSELKDERIYPIIMKDPFTSLRPCLTFKCMGWRSDFITIEEILTKLELRLEEYGIDDGRQSIKSPTASEKS